jgi:hypothetical protein
MPNKLWKPVPSAVVQAARQARADGLSLRAIAAELASKDMLSPSGRTYLPGSIAAMLRDHVDAGHDDPARLRMLTDRDYLGPPPAALEGVVDDIDIEVDVADHTEPAADAVDAVPTPPAAVVDAVDVAPSVDAPVFDAAHGLAPLDVDETQQPLTEPEPQPVDAAPPAVDAEPVKPRWQPQRTNGLIDFRSLMLRLCDVPHLQEAAMASAGLRVDQMGSLASRGDWRECVANWLSHNT